MGFPDRLREARVMRGLTQAQVASKIGVVANAYCSYENGKREPNFDKTRKIAKVLRVSADDLLEIESPKADASESENSPFFGIDRELIEALSRSQKLQELLQMLVDLPVTERKAMLGQITGYIKLSQVASAEKK